MLLLISCCTAAQSWLINGLRQTRVVVVNDIASHTTSRQFDVSANDADGRWRSNTTTAADRIGYVLMFGNTDRWWRLDVGSIVTWSSKKNYSLAGVVYCSHLTTHTDTFTRSPDLRVSFSSSLSRSLVHPQQQQPTNRSVLDSILFFSISTTAHNLSFNPFI